MLFQTSISAFKNARDVTSVPVTLGQFLNDTKRVGLIQQLRLEQDKAKRDALKKELPAATISGVFQRREAAAIERYNGLVCLDFDGKENPNLNPEEMKRMLAEYTEVAYAATSVGGAGVFAIIPTNNTKPEFHSVVVEALGAILKGEGLIYDRACKDVCRLRFITYDPQPYINHEAPLFNVDAIIQKHINEAFRPPRPHVAQQNPASETANRTQKKVERYIQALEASARDVTENYEDWFKLGFALAHEFGFEGEQYFHRISWFNPKYNQAECSKKYYQLLKTGKEIKIGTFFDILKRHGIVL